MATTTLVPQDEQKLASMFSAAPQLGHSALSTRIKSSDESELAHGDVGPLVAAQHIATGY